MTSEKKNIIQVMYCSKLNPINVGRLALINRKIFFEYSPEFLELQLEISPFKLPLKQGVMACEDRLFDGLFGVFNDSLPDGFGRLLLDRKLMNRGINPSKLTPLDRLKYVGTRGMGALQYVPEYALDSFDEKPIELDFLAEECLKFQINDQDEFLDELLVMNGSSLGARPKILVSINQQSRLQMTDNKFSHSHHDWIVKFRASFDPSDIGPIEYAYHLMAVDAGLIVPEAKLFKSKKGHGFFGVKRFDRAEHMFLHAHTLSGLLHADHRIPSLDYESVMKATAILTKNVRQSENQFRNIVFNVFSHNRDDHAKNFSFIMDETGTWTVSPAYDLTFSTGPGGEHCTTIVGNGKNPGTLDLIKLANISGINKEKALVIIGEVRAAISKWQHFAKEAHVSSQSTNIIHAQLIKIL